MTSMFEHCYSLKRINVNTFDMSKVTSTARMFFQCSSLTTIYCDSTWNVPNSQNMFTYDTNLVGAVYYRDKRVDNGTMANPKTGYFTGRYKLGDLNGDGYLDVADINLMINVILGHASIDDCVITPDLNFDQRVDVSDVNLLTNIILGK